MSEKAPPSPLPVNTARRVSHRPSLCSVAQVTSYSSSVSPRRESAYQWRSFTESHGTCGHFRIVEVPLNRLYFYQSAIAGAFSDGRSLQSTVDSLRQGTITPRDMPLPHVVLRGKRLYCMGTRRLACFNFAWRRTDPAHLIPVIWDGSNNPDALPQGNDTDMIVFGGLSLDGQYLTRITRGPAELDVDVRDFRRQWMSGKPPIARITDTSLMCEEYFWPSTEHKAGSKKTY